MMGINSSATLGGSRSPKSPLALGYIHYLPFPELWRSQDLAGAEPHKLLTPFLSCLAGPRRQQSLQMGPEVTSKNHRGRKNSRFLPGPPPSPAPGRAAEAAEPPEPPVTPSHQRSPWQPGCPSCASCWECGVSTRHPDLSTLLESCGGSRTGFPAPGRIGTLNEPHFGVWGGKHPGDSLNSHPLHAGGPWVPKIESMVLRAARCRPILIPCQLLPFPWSTWHHP